MIKKFGTSLTPEKFTPALNLRPRPRPRPHIDFSAHPDDINDS